MADVVVKNWDEENEAVRMFLLFYGGSGGITVEEMRGHMGAAGHNGCWPLWVDTDEGQGHLTKAGAQDWIKYLLLYTNNEEN